jgi:hypothetical protein
MRQFAGQGITRRRAGKDARFNVAGTRSGRLTFDEEVKLRELEARAKRRKQQQSQKPTE